MSQLNDLVVAVTGGPTFSDSIRAWEEANGIEDWWTYLNGLGYTGHINDMEYEYWSDQLAAGSAFSSGFSSGFS
mgnify:CR=1 FL=1